MKSPLRDANTGERIETVSCPVSANAISWRRLFNEALRLSGEIKPDEEVVAFREDGRGLEYWVRRRQP